MRLEQPTLSIPATQRFVCAESLQPAPITCPNLAPTSPTASARDILPRNASCYCVQVEFELLQHMELLRRDARVRVKQWLQKFRQETANAVWKRNRNMHARLLLEQLRAGRLTHPFTSMPGPGSLPILGRWTLAPFLTPQKKPAIPRCSLN